MKLRYQFIQFREQGKMPGNPPRPTWCCYNNRSRELLGQVEYYGQWRQWVYSPAGPAVYSAGCLADIQAFIGQLSVAKVPA